jgi:uncharacterized DUF497 family protein
MVFEWDEMKSFANAKTRGLPFEIAMALLTDRQGLISTFQRSIGSVWQRRRIGKLRNKLRPIRIRRPFFPPAS